MPRKPTPKPASGAPDLQMPASLRAPLLKHLEDLRQLYLKREWGGRVGFGRKPALIVIDLAGFWTDSARPYGPLPHGRSMRVI